LTFIEEGNADRLEGMINFKKCTLVVQTILMLQNYQFDAYRKNLQVEDQIFAFLEELPFLDDREMYELSSVLEPRTKKDTS